MKSKHICTCTELHERAISEASAHELSTATLLSLAELFKTLGDPSRLRIVTALSTVTELCVCDLCEVLAMTQSAVSHQLAVLRRAGLVRYRKSGKSIFYALDDEHVKILLSAGKEHVEEKK